MKLQKKQMMKKVVLSAAILGTMNSQAAFLNIVNKSMATINPKAEVAGPIYRHETKAEDKYGDEVATILLQEAHKKAKRLLSEGNTQAYYAFMVLALTVPNQEGLYVHFREVPAEKDYCRDDRSRGKGIKSEKAQAHFNIAMNNHKEDKFLGGMFGSNRKREKDGFLLPCSMMEKGQETYRQLIVGGWDGSDVGMMQVSALYHYDNFLKPQKFKSVRETVNYGLGYIKQRFDRAVGKYSSPEYVNDPDSSYACFTNADGSVNYQAIVQGSWSAYNGGPAQICRFTKMDDPNNDYAGHDKGFLASIKNTTDLNKGRFFGYNKEGELPLTETVKKALAEVVTNYEQGTNSRQFISQVIGE